MDHIGDVRGGPYTATIERQDGDSCFNVNDYSVTKVRLINLSHLSSEMDSFLSVLV